MDNSIAERVKELRTVKKLSQEAFGEKLGVGKTAISKIEKGERNLTEQMAKAICREYRVNYAWLMEGIGEAFSNLPETLLDEMVEEYDLDELDKQLVRGYLNLSQEQRKLFRSLINMEFLKQEKGE